MSDYYNNNNNNLIYKAPVCRGISVALDDSGNRADLLRLNAWWNKNAVSLDLKTVG